MDDLEIDDLTYPGCGRPMLSHKKLGPICRAVCRKAMQTENVAFLDAVLKKTANKKLWEDFISPDAKRPINISGSTRKPFIDAAKIQDWYSKPVWKKALNAAADEIELLLESNVTEKKFMDNAAFRAYHNARLYKIRTKLFKRKDFAKEMKKVRNFLDITDDNTTNKDLNEAYAALKYVPKKSKNPIAKAANSIGKKASDLKKAFERVMP